VRTKIKAFETALEGNDKALSENSYKILVKALDTASGKGIFHKNTIARKKSRLFKKFALLGA